MVAAADLRVVDRGLFFDHLVDVGHRARVVDEEVEGRVRVDKVLDDDRPALGARAVAVIAQLGVVVVAIGRAIAHLERRQRDAVGHILRGVLLEAVDSPAQAVGLLGREEAADDDVTQAVEVVPEAPLPRAQRCCRVWWLGWGAGTAGSAARGGTPLRVRHREGRVQGGRLAPIRAEQRAHYRRIGAGCPYGRSFGYYLVPRVTGITATQYLGKM